MSRSLVMALLSFALIACGTTTQHTEHAPGVPSSSEHIAAFDPIGAYRTGGDCAHGSPENPTCVMSLRLDVGGTGSFVGDDIVEDATWGIEGEQIVVHVGTYHFSLRYGPNHTLIGEHDEVWSPDNG
jgi:hypothetical protein